MAQPFPFPALNMSDPFAEPAQPPARSQSPLPAVKVSPSLQAAIDAKDELDQNPRGALGEIFTGAKRGVAVQFPKMIGQTAQYFSPSDTSGLAEFGKGMVKSAEARGRTMPLAPEQHGKIVNALAQGAEMAGPLAPVLLPAAALGAPEAATAGALGALFAGSMGQQAKEDVAAAGGSPEAAQRAGFGAATVGALTAAAGSVVGSKFLLGRFGATGGQAADTVMNTLRNPTLLKPVVTDVAKAAAGGVVLNAAQSGAVAAIEQHYGVKTSPFDAAVQSIAPTLGMVALGTPLNVMARMRQNAALKGMASTYDQTMANPAVDIGTKSNASKAIGDVLEQRGADPKSVVDWRVAELERANAAAAATEPQPEVPQPPPLALPAPVIRMGQQEPAPMSADLRAALDASVAQNDLRRTEIIRQQAVAQNIDLRQQLQEAGLPTTEPLSMTAFVKQLRTSRAGPLAAGGKIDQRAVAVEYSKRLLDENERMAQVLQDHPQEPPAAQGELFAAPRLTWSGPAERFAAGETARMPTEDAAAQVYDARRAETIRQQAVAQNIALRQQMQEAGLPTTKPLAMAAFAKQLRLAPAGELGVSGKVDQRAITTEYSKRLLDENEAMSKALSERQQAVPAEQGDLGFGATNKERVDATTDAERAAAHEALAPAENSPLNPALSPGAVAQLRRQAEYTAAEQQAQARAKGTDTGGPLGAKVGDKAVDTSATTLAQLRRQAGMEQLRAAESGQITHETPVVASDAAKLLRQVAADGGFTGSVPSVWKKLQGAFSGKEKFADQMAALEGAIGKEKNGDHAILMQDLRDKLTGEPYGQVAENVGARAKPEPAADQTSPADTGRRQPAIQGTPAAVKAGRAIPERKVVEETKNAAETRGQQEGSEQQYQGTGGNRTTTEASGRNRAIQRAAGAAETQGERQKVKRSERTQQALEARRSAAIAQLEKIVGIVAESGTPEYRKAAAVAQVLNALAQEQRGKEPSSLADIQKAERIIAEVKDGVALTSRAGMNDRNVLAARRDVVLNALDQIANTRAEKGTPEFQRALDASRIMNALEEVKAGLIPKPDLLREDLRQAEKFIAGGKLPKEWFMEGGHETAAKYTDLLRRETDAPRILDTIFKDDTLPSDIRGLADHIAAYTKGLQIVHSGKLAESSTRLGMLKLGSFDGKRITINVGGEHPRVILHEVMHALTSGRLENAMRSHDSWLASHPEGVANNAPPMVQAYANLTKLMAHLDQASDRFYGMRSPHEFIAEVFSNRAFQEFLRSQKVPDGLLGKIGTRAKTMWDAVVSAVRNLMGLPRESENALTAAMDLSTPFFEAFSERSAARALEMVGGFNESPHGAFEAISRGLGSLSDTWDKTLQRSDFLANGDAAIRKALLAASSALHIRLNVDRLPALAPLKEGMAAHQEAQVAKDYIHQRRVNEYTDFLMPVKRMFIASGKFTEKTAQLGRLAGEQSRLGLDLDKTFAENLKHSQWLTPQMAGEFATMQKEWAAMSPAERAAVQQSYRLARKYMTLSTADFLRNILDQYREYFTPTDVEAFRAQLDMRDPRLAKAANPDAKVFYDGETAELHRAIVEVSKKVLGMGPTDAGAKDFNARKDMFTQLEAAVKENNELYAKSQHDPYAYLGRSGDYHVGLTVQDSPEAYAAVKKIMEAHGKVMGPFRGESRRVFTRFNNLKEMEAVRRELDAIAEQAIERGDDGYDISSGKLADTSANNLKGVPTFIRQMMNKLDVEFMKNPAFNDETRSAALEFMRRNMIERLPDSAAAKAMARRHGTPGYDADFLATVGKRAEGMASSLSNSYSLPMFERAFETMDQGVKGAEHTAPGDAIRSREVYDELQKRFSNSMQPIKTPVIDALGTLGYHYFLSASPSFVAMNLLQPAQLGLPWMGGRYGYVRSAKEMGRASAAMAGAIKDALGTALRGGTQQGGLKGALVGLADAGLDFGKLPAELRPLMEYLRDRNVLADTMAYDLSQVAEGQTSTRATISRMLALGAHWSEVLNRGTMGIAAYRAEMARSGSTDAAFKAAESAIRETQFDYTQANTARAFGKHGVLGKVTPLAAQFQRYGFYTNEFLMRNLRDILEAHSRGLPEAEATQLRAQATKTFAGALGTSFVVAGLYGLPYATLGFAAMNLFGNIFGVHDDDLPADSQRWVRQWLADVVGNDAGEIIAHGGFRAVGADVAARVGLQDVLPGSSFFANRQQFADKVKNSAVGMWGPAVGIGASMVQAGGLMSDGRLLDGLVAMMPSALRGPAKAIQAGQEGYINGSGNQIPIPVTPWAQFVQTLGFTPGVKAEQAEANRMFQAETQNLAKARAPLENAAYRAIEQGEDTGPAIEAVSAFNARHPGAGANIGRGLRRRAAERAIAETSGTGILANKRAFPRLQAYNFANDEEQ